jgi:outer membrane protein assembly factor BamB/predicted phosphodiesterase
VQGVVVTDGQNTVKTLEDGKFTLPGYEKTRFITITTPAGYETEKYYIPVNESVKTCDFAVYPSERTKQAEHSFIQITDTEIHNRGTANSWVAYLKDFVRTEKASFLIHTGDICYESGLRNHIQVVNAKTMDCPVYYCIGNHDLVKGEYGEQLFESIYGPVWYSFDIGNVHYVVTPMANGDHKPGYTRKEIYQWLQNDLAMMTPGKQLVIFNHNILTASDHFYFGTGETERINLRDYNLKAWIYGHWHYNYVRNQAGIYTVCTATLDKGGIDHSPSAFRFFRMQKDSIASMNLHYCFLERQTVIACPSEGQTAPILPDGRIPVSVNAYHSGCEIKQVTYRFTDKRDNRGYQKMLRKSDWNWYAEIRPPQDSSQPQTMELEIATEFNDGKSTLSTCRFLYDPDNKPGIKTGQDWFNLLKDAAHRGNSSDSLKLPLQLGWINNLGSNIFMTSPLIANRRIFIAATDDHQAEKQGVFALDERTGRILWKYPTRNSVKNSIAYDLNTVFAQDANGWLYAIDADSGKLRWEKQPDPGFFPYLEDGLIACNGVVYAGTGTGLGAYRGMDGTAIWLNKAWKKGEGTTTTLTLGNNVLTAGVQWTALYGNNAETGELLWKLSNDGLSDRGASTVLHEDQFYVISRNSLFIIEPLTGKILRQKQLTEFNLNVTSTPLITDSEVIFGTADKGIVALDKENLSVKWNTITGQSLVYTSPYTTLPFASVETSPVVSNGIVYFGASDGYLYGVKAGTGEIVWKYRTGAPVFASVAISGNALIAVDFSGNVYAFYGLNHSDI